ncbi:unnamed protein product [Haemonchus placei]|uniref:Protein FAM98A n=1 Tax=Haemonchus placei TaxID=6290 RepID=A0A0N4WBY4_HAEPC|nr:unnamed protein product [Haemonchus placei]
MEAMEVDVVLPSLSSSKLFGLSEAAGFDDISAVVNTDISKGFGQFVSLLCEELKALYKMEEAVPRLGENGDNLDFLLELSSFIAELECPHEELTCGSLEERLSTVEKRALLVNFLLNELKAARLYACNELAQPVLEQQGDKELTPYLTSALKAAGVPKPKDKFEPIDIIDMLHKGLVEEVAQNCRSRSLLILKRIDVTVNSFLWCNRIKPKEAEIRELFAKRREEMSHFTPPTVADLLAASQDLLRIEQASSARLRKNTRSKIHPLALAARPTDRGGRTNEMIGEIAKEQASAQRGRGRGGGPGGYQAQPSHQQYQQSHQQSYQQNYQQPYQQNYQQPNYQQPYQQSYQQPYQQQYVSREQMIQREYRGSYQDGPRGGGRGGPPRGGRGGGRGYDRGGYYGHDNRY